MGDSRIRGVTGPFLQARALGPGPWPSPQLTPRGLLPVARAGTSLKASYKGPIGSQGAETSGLTCPCFREQSRPCSSNKNPI